VTAHSGFALRRREIAPVIDGDSGRRCDRSTGVFDRPTTRSVRARASIGSVGRVHARTLLLLLIPTTAFASPTLELVDMVTGPRGCAPRLLGKQEHRFLEAQLACDAFLSLALVSEALDGTLEKPAAATAVRRLLADSRSRGRLPFARSPKSILRRGYELLILAGLARLEASSEPERLGFDALAAEVRADVDAAAPAFVESFKGQYWPCDSSPAAAGLLLHGALTNSIESSRAGERLVARLEALRRAEGGFVTRVDATGRATEMRPRGTVLAWTAGFLSLADPVTGRAFADDFYERFCDAEVVVLGVTLPASCREWPRGVDGKPDAVSGPIVDGQGTGATALGIAALRSSGRATDADHLTATAALVELMPAAKGLAVGPLERSILAWAAVARPWLPVPAAERQAVP
jgi:hypothetical protein